MDGEKKNLGDGVVGERVGPDRWRFEVEMKPFGQTTVVSWKEMMKKAINEPPSDSDSDDSDVDKYNFAQREDTQETPRVDESDSHVINQEGQQKTSRSKTSVSLKDRTEERVQEIMDSQQNKRKRYELSIPNVPYTRRAQRTASVHMTDASRLAHKKLGWSILQLKKLVKTSKTSLADVKRSGAPSLQTENRLHPQFKEKLAKVARQTPLHEGQISEELIDHLMGILRNYFQRKTLKIGSHTTVQGNNQGLNLFDDNFEEHLDEFMDKYLRAEAFMTTLELKIDSFLADYQRILQDKAIALKLYQIIEKQ